MRQPHPHPHPHPHLYRSKPTTPTTNRIRRPVTLPPDTPTGPPADISPGLLVLHGNRAELLGEAVFAWLRRQPLQPLEQEVFLVQSNAVAEWLKMAQATRGGIFAAARVELPGRFLWRAYRQVLGAGAVPAESALDKLPLTWRLMQQLPALQDQPGYEPLAGFLNRGGLERRLQLAQRLADLYDQYQVYRPDWLAAWAAGSDCLPRQVAEPLHSAPPLPLEQAWQSALWRALLAPLDAAQRGASRPQLHSRFLAALQAGALPASPLPRRVVLFGMSQLALPTLQALAALSAHCQVLLAVPNPCRYHWADILPGRELLRQARRRHPLRQGRDLAELGLEDMHAHAHPLLAAWGRQGRDFVRQLDAFDDAQLAQQRFALNKIDLFDDGPGETLLQQVQARIRDLVPLAEHAGAGGVNRELPAGASAAAGECADAADRSIVFHIAHSAQREVEILHDQLLALLAGPSALAAADDPNADNPVLQARDVVVMVPNIASFAPAIRSVFGQVARSDARYIPFDIADLQERGNNPLLQALEWLLGLPLQRCGQSELRDLLDVPAVAARFGLAEADLPRLAQWVAGAGIRWGLDAGQRHNLGLAACGEQNSWLFGIRRMLLGYAVGELGGGDPSAAEPAGSAAWPDLLQTIEPYAEIGGLDAAHAGALAALVEALQAWATLAATEATPAAWGQRCQDLIARFFAATDERERATLLALQDALRAWRAACTLADFEQPVSLAVLREAWLGGLDAPGLNRRFRAGGVTFCSLMPMRAVPFEVVCLLGMNDGDYPRRSPRSDFDLMGQPGQARPGDRSRRDDDRQLMLEALLSARRVLYVSWTGRSARDNSDQPPSVLVSQLRDYLAAGWRGPVLAARTTEHPLQPFSRRYFEQTGKPSGAAPARAAGVAPSAVPGDEAGPPPLFTFAREWRAAHDSAAPGHAGADVVAGAVGGAGAVNLCDAAAGESVTALPIDTAASPQLTVAALATFLKNPVRDFFRRQLDVVFGDGEAAAVDEEAFGLDGLEQHGLLQALIQQGLAALQDSAARPGASDVDPNFGVAAATAAAATPPSPPSLSAVINAQVARVQRAGQLPMAEPGRRAAQALAQTGLRMFGCWTQLQSLYPQALPKQPLRLTCEGLLIDDWQDGLRCPPEQPEAAVWLQLSASRLSDDPVKPRVRRDVLVPAWVRCLVAAACGVPARGLIVGRDAWLSLDPLPQDEALAALQTLVQTWQAGMTEPLPLALRSALAAAAGTDAAVVYEGRSYLRGSVPAECDEPCLARLYPDFEALAADGRFDVLAEALFGPMLGWIENQVQITLFDADAPTDLGKLRNLPNPGETADTAASARTDD